MQITNFNWIFCCRNRRLAYIWIGLCVNIIYSKHFLKSYINIASCFCSTVVGIRGKDGVVFGVERLVQSRLYEDDANKRIFHIDLHIGMVIQLLIFKRLTLL